MKLQYPLINSILLLFGIILINNCRHSTISIGGNHPLEAISTTNAVFFYTPNFTDLLEERDASILLASLEQVPTLQEDINRLHLLEQINSKGRTAFAWSFQLTGQGALHSTCILDISGTAIRLETLKEQLGWEEISFSQFKKQKIYAFEEANGIPFALSIVENLLIIAKYPFQIEDAIVQLIEETGINTQKSFRAIQDRKSSSLYLNWSFLPDFLSEVLLTDIYGLKELATWCRIDLSKEPINGQIHFKQKKLNKAFKQQKAGDIETLSTILPANLAFFTWLSLTDAERFFDGYGTKPTPWFNDFILPWLHDEVALINMGQPEHNDLCALFKFKELAAAKKGLEDLLDYSGLLEDYSYQSFRIQQLVEENLLGPLTSDWGPKMTNPYFTIIEDYVIFSSSKLVLESWIDFYIVGKTLQNEPSFQQFHQKGAKLKHGFLYLNVEYASKAMEKSFRKKDKTLSTITRYFLQYYAHLGLDLKQDGQLQLTSAELDKTANNHQVRWKSQLDTAIIRAPRFLSINERAPKVILVQDAQYTLYLLELDGQIRWKLPLESPIQSDFFLIDYYENGENQILFSTKRSIHLINKAGNRVGAYPIQLQSNASNGLQVVEFGGVGDYTFFIACENKSIYAYDKRGRPIYGWNPMSGIGEIPYPLLHFQYDQKDYLIFCTTSNEVHVFKPDGTYLFAPIALGAPLVGAPSYQLRGNNARIVLPQRNGKIRIMKPDGSHFNLNTTQGRPLHDFQFAPICGDDRNDYVSLSNRTLNVQYYAKNDFKRKFDYTFETKPDAIFALSRKQSKNNFVGAVDTKKRQIFLIDSSGELIPGFPLAGNTDFEMLDLYENDAPIIAVGNDDVVYCYQLAMMSSFEEVADRPEVEF